jgi:hypothetical protein
MPEREPEPRDGEETAPEAYEPPAAEELPNAPAATSPGVPQNSPG